MNQYVFHKHLFFILKDKFSKCTDSLVILCPYIKYNALSKLCRSINEHCDVTIVMRWNEYVFRTGSSDAAVYNYCIEKDYELRYNNRLHEKSYLIDDKEYITGSCNISDAALGIGEQNNIEALVTGMVANEDIRKHTYNIIKSSPKVDSKLYKIVADIDSSCAQEPTEETLGLEPWFIYDLPSTSTVEQLINHFENNTTNADLDRLGIPKTISSTTALELTRQQFLNSTLMHYLKERLRQGPLHFGELKQWICDNCADQPRPRAQDITERASNLLNWIHTFGEGKFDINVPEKYSEKVSYDTRTDYRPSIRYLGERPSRPVL